MIARLSNSCNYLLQFTLFQVLTFLLLSKNTIILGFTNETDRQALLAIKDLIPEDPLNVLSSWNHSLHFCQWTGVTCSRRHQRVISLNLSALHLAGTLSPQIGNLTFLRGIYLNNNSFHGTIPQDISRLFGLQYLKLHFNLFQGTFPTNLTCSGISRIHLYDNNIGGNIPSELGSLSDLEELILATNIFSGSIPSSLGNLTSLRVLEVSNNKLVGNIPWELSLLSNLQVLDVGSNKLSGTVPLPLYNISSVRGFALYNMLQGKLPPDLGLTLLNLEEFLIHSNEFTGSIPHSIANASALVMIEISSNSFVGPLPTNFGSLPNLTWLQVYDNKLGTNSPPNHLNFIIKSLINCTNLYGFTTDGNGFGGELPHLIVNLSSSLGYLNLGSNNLTGSIPLEFGNLQANLRRLTLFDNMLSGSIPKSIGKLSKLQLLAIYGNNISGEIPASIGNISFLSHLFMKNNRLEGRIPVTLGNLTNLLILGFGNNHISGAIPEQIFGHSSVINVFFVYQNQLTGRLPMSIGNLKNLNELAISGNRLTGEIPNTLGNCLMVEYLEMDNNFFWGTIPSTFENLKSLLVLDLSYNNLSGQIPKFLAELNLFEELNLSHNNFQGEVPTKGVFSNVSMLTLDGNLQLCGGIHALKLPACHTKCLKKRRESFPHKYIPLLVILPAVILIICLVITLSLLGRSKERNNPSTPALQDQHPQLSYAELHRATNGFSLTNLIGEGRYGSVYKGILTSVSEQVIAVKVLNVELRGATKGFLAECEIFRNIRHRNLVKIITTCSSTDFAGSDFKALVLEYMPNGSLDSWLQPNPMEQDNNRILTLLQRLNIAVDVAAAVDYLHNHCHTKIVHCDLKPSNVLLDEELNAHVSDFGLAKILSDTSSESSWSEASSIGIRGTTGYVPPEYGMGGEVSSEGDVYSYGIFLLELFIGKRPTDIMFTGCYSLRNYVSEALPQRVSEIVDPRIVMEDTHTTISKTEQTCLPSILQVGVSCCVDRPRDRMDIAIVVKELIRLRNLFVA